LINVKKNQKFFLGSGGIPLLSRLAALCLCFSLCHLNFGLNGSKVAFATFHAAHTSKTADTAQSFKDYAEQILADHEIPFEWPRYEIENYHPEALKDSYDHRENIFPEKVS
jgi:hypothetical protein